MLVDDLADVRAGDKGDTLILAVLPRDDPSWRVLRERLDADAVARRFGLTGAHGVVRREAPGLPALVFRLPGLLGGGVTGSVALDGHGKTLGYHLLGLEL